jgi:hypothetical protein
MTHEVCVRPGDLYIIDQGGYPSTHKRCGDKLPFDDEFPWHFALRIDTLYEAKRGGRLPDIELVKRIGQR